MGRWMARKNKAAGVFATRNLPPASSPKMLREAEAKIAEGRTGE